MLSVHSKWAYIWVAFSVILGIIGLILGAYATAEVNKIGFEEDEGAFLPKEDFYVFFDRLQAQLCNQGIKFGNNGEVDRVCPPS